MSEVSLLPAPQCHPRKPGDSVVQPCLHSQVRVPCGLGIILFLSHLRHVLARKQGETGHCALLSMLFAELVPKVLTRDDELAKARPLPGSPSARFPSCCGHGVFEAPHPCGAWALASRPAPGLRDTAQGLGVRLASPLPSMCSRGRGSVPCRVGTHGPLTGRDGGNARCTE